MCANAATGQTIFKNHQTYVAWNFTRYVGDLSLHALRGRRRGYFHVLFRRQSEADKWWLAGDGRQAISKNRMLTLSREAWRNFWHVSPIITCVCVRAIPSHIVSSSPESCRWREEKNKYLTYASFNGAETSPFKCRIFTFDRGFQRTTRPREKPRSFSRRF